MEQHHAESTHEVRSDIEGASLRSRKRDEALSNRVDTMEEEQVKLNAAAFPLIGFGIVISGLDGELAAAPLWLDWTVLGVAVIASARVVSPNIRAWHVERRERMAVEGSEA